MLGDLVGRLTTTFDGKFISELIRYFGVVNVPVWMFAFTRVYCGKYISRRTIAWLFVVPVLSYVMMATSRWQTLFFTKMEVASYGLKMNYGNYFYYVHLPYSYLLSLISVALVLNEIGRVPKQFRSQIFFLVISLCVPMTINMLGVSGYLGNDYDTALSFPVFAILLSIGVVRHRLLQVNPIAYENVVPECARWRHHTQSRRQDSRHQRHGGAPYGQTPQGTHRHGIRKGFYRVPRTRVESWQQGRNRR